MEFVDWLTANGPDFSLTVILIWLFWDTRKRLFACWKEQRELLREVHGMPRTAEDLDLG